MTKDAHRDQQDKSGDPEKDPYMYGQLIYHKDATIIQLENSNIFNKLYCVN